jgi:hypothetical protein
MKHDRMLIHVNLGRDWRRCARYGGPVRATITGTKQIHSAGPDDVRIQWVDRQNIVILALRFGRRKAEKRAQ